MSGMKFRIFAISAVVAMGVTNSIASLPNYLTEAEMAEIRGTSAMACQATATCDAFNFSIDDRSCLGKEDDSPCSTCGNSSLEVNYVGKSGQDCNGGWKTYSDDIPADKNCGGRYYSSYCKKEVCIKSGISTGDCKVPRVVIDQPH